MGCEQIQWAEGRRRCYELQRGTSSSSGATSGPATYVEDVEALPTNGVNVPKTWDQVWVNTATPQGVAGASDYDSTVYNTRVPKAQVPGFYSLPASEQAMFTRAAKAVHPLKTGASFYEELTEASWDLSKTGVYKSPQSLAYSVLTGGLYGDGGGGGGGGGGFGGGAAPQPADASAVRRAMDTLSRNMLGRTLSNREFRDYYKQYKTEFAGNPDVDMQQNGIEALQRNDDYQEYQVATKFASAMESVIRGGAT